MWPFTRRSRERGGAPLRESGPQALKPGAAASPWESGQPAAAAATAAAAAKVEACPTTPCTTCGNPMPIVAFTQACPRCRTVLPPASSCPGGCGSCEMGAKAK